MIELQVEGMTCGSCTEHVKQALEQVAGVRSASVSYPQGLAAIATDGHVGLEPLIAVVTALGYRARGADGSAGPFDQASGWSVGKLHRRAMSNRCTLPSLAAAAPPWRPRSRRRKVVPASR